MGQPVRKIIQLSILSIAFVSSSITSADSFRCGRKLVKQNESVSALVKKCGQPVRKFNGRQDAWIKGMQKRVSVSNWVYERRGKRDMVVSIHNGAVIRIEVEK